jgi:hypothetical protein
MPKSLANAGFSALFWSYGYFWMFILPASADQAPETQYTAGAIQMAVFKKRTSVFVRRMFCCFFAQKVVY